MLNAKKLAVATLIAVSAGTAVLAAPPVLDPANADLAVSVILGGSTDTTLTLDANRLLDANELIRLNYGFTGADSSLKIREVIAPEGITVALKDAPTLNSSLTSDDSGTGFENVLTVGLTVTSTNQNSGSYPVQVVLENSVTGEATTLNLIVQAGS
jgi:hypothetical protein